MKIQWQGLKTVLLVSKILVGSVVTLLVTIVLTLVLLIGTEKGRAWSLDYGINWYNSTQTNYKILLAASENDVNKHIASIQWPAFNVLSVNQVNIYKNNNLWLTVDQLELHWLAKALFNRKIQITSLTAKHIDYWHQPSASASTNDAPTTAIETQIDTILNQLLSDNAKEIPGLHLEQLKVDQLSLNDLPFAQDHPNQQNVNLNYTIEGQFKYTNIFGITAALKAKPQIDTLPNFSIEIELKDTQTLDLVANIEEEPAGLLAQLLQLPKELPISSRLKSKITKQDNGAHVDIETLAFPILKHQLNLTGTIELLKEKDKTGGWRIKTKDTELFVDQTRQTFHVNYQSGVINAAFKLDRLPLDWIKIWQTELDYKNAFVSGQYSVNGSFQQVNYQLDNALLMLDYQDIPIKVITNAQGNRSEVKIEQLTASAYYHSKEPISLKANGKLALNNENHELNWRVSNVTTKLMGELAPSLKLPTELHAKLVEAQGLLSGSTQNPLITTEASIHGNYQNTPFTLFTKAKGQKHQANVESLEIALSNLQNIKSTNKLSGIINWQSKSANLSLNLQDFPITLANSFGNYIPEDVTGNISGKAELIGNFKSPKIATDLSLEGHVKNVPYSAISQVGYYQNNLTINDLSISSNNELLANLQGNYTANNFDLHLKLVRLPQHLLEAFAIDFPFTQLSSELSLQGQLPQITVDGFINAKPKVNLPRAEDNPTAKDVTLNTALQSHQGKLSIKTTIVDKDLAENFFQVDLPIVQHLEYWLRAWNKPVESMPLDATITGKIDLAAISFLTEAEYNQLNGLVDTNLTTSGTLQKPTLTGEAKLININYFNPTTGATIEKGNCLISASRFLLTLDDCQAKDGYRGTYKLGGEVRLPDHNQGDAIDISLETKKVSLLKRPDIENQTSGGIRVLGNFKELTAKGVMKVSPLDAIIDINFGKSVPTINVDEVYAETPEPNTNPIFTPPKINLDILLQADQQAYVRGRGLEAELAGQVHLQGTATAPNITGGFNTLRGSFEVFGRKFNLEKGEVNFVNDKLLLSVRGVYQKKGKTIIAEIIGDNNDYRLLLSSIPSLPEDEILSFIIFGESAQEISAIKAIQLASAIQTLRGGGGGGFFDPITFTRESLGFDTFSIDNETTETGESGINVGIGKYLNERVYLELERSPSDSQPWKGTIEIELTPKINLQSTTGGNSGIDSAEIIWSNDY